FIDGALFRQTVAHGDIDPEKIIQRDHPGFIREIYLDDVKSIKKSDWKLLVHHEPWIVMHLLSNLERGTGIVFDDSTLRHSFIEGITSQLVLSDYVAKWGTLFDLPEGLGANLRRVALQTAGAPVNVDHYSRPLKSFNLNLPEEAAMLPHLIGLMVGEG